ncbi:MAG: hypothetical protein CSA25_00060 [Desulfobacter postgatei]|uniref:Uncharacterized protein n=1 Tax=Desulfobacter postgatei TaxID=2293 RepID=A0A2G6MTS9_9BACT|nr:MAG: hypothetical protein CSA25_00060 [Desulfobacter postgatei]
MRPLACLDGDLKSGAVLGALILIMGLKFMNGNGVHMYDDALLEGGPDQDGDAGAFGSDKIF